MDARLLDRFMAYLGGAPTTGPSIYLLAERPAARARYAPRSINQILAAIKRFYAMLGIYAESGVDLSTTDPVRPWDKPFKGALWHIQRRKGVKREKRRRTVAPTQQTPRLTPEQVLKLINVCTNMRDVLLLVVCYNTGARIGEVLGLRHSDINHQDCIISLYKREDNENGARAKSWTPRHVPVNPYVIRMYEDYLVSDEYRAAFETGSDYVFTNIFEGRIGRALTYDAAQQLCRALRKRARLHFTWHWFRHTHLSECIASGYDLLQVADRAGHADINTTNEFYKHLFDHEYKRKYLQSDAAVRDQLRRLQEERLDRAV
jgi:integrase